MPSPTLGLKGNLDNTTTISFLLLVDYVLGSLFHIDVCSSETSSNFYRSAGRHIPEGTNKNKLRGP
jgi:hypothetical protein